MVEPGCEDNHIIKFYYFLIFYYMIVFTPWLYHLLLYCIVWASTSTYFQYSSTGVVLMMSTSLSVILLATVLLKSMQCSVFHQPSAMILMMKMLSRSSYHRCPREDWVEWRGWQSGRRLPNQQWHSSRHWGARPGPWWRDQFLPAEDTVDQPDSRIVLTQVYQTFTRVIPPSPRYCPTATSEHRNLQIKNDRIR